MVGAVIANHHYCSTGGISFGMAMWTECYVLMTDSLKTDHHLSKQNLKNLGSLCRTMWEQYSKNSLKT